VRSKTDGVLWVLSALLAGFVVWFYANAYHEKKHAKCPPGTTAEVLRHGLYCVTKPELK
jgi:hypothetical protein